MLNGGFYIRIKKTTIFAIYTCILLLLTITCIPAFGQSTEYIRNSDRFTSKTNKDHYKNSLLYIDEINYWKECFKFSSSYKNHLISVLEKNEKSFSELGKIYLGYFTMNITFLLGILAAIVTFALSFSFGAIAVGFPDLLPLMVKWLEIISAGVFVGILVECGFIWFNSYSDTLVDHIQNNITLNQGLKNLSISMIHILSNLTNDCMFRGGLVSLSGIITSLTFLKYWNLYKIVQMIGGGLLISIPITIPVVVYLLYIDRVIFNAIY